MLKCKFCKADKKNKNSLAQHERLCKLNPEKQTTPFQDLSIQQNKKKSNQFLKAEELGLEKPVFSVETLKILSLKATKNNLARSDEVYKKQSATVKRKIENDEWHLSVRKSIVVEYAGNKFHSTWEVKYAKWLDDQGIKWIRTRDKFPYIWNNKSHYYFPDFYLPETDEYVEIKGYKTQRDDAKWIQFPKDKVLIVLLEKDLKHLGVI